MHNQSFIHVAKQKVLEKCDRVIENIYKYNDAKKSAYIRGCMEKWNGGWWHKFRKKTDYTMETAEQRIKNEIHADLKSGLFNGRHFWSDYSSSYGALWLEIAGKIKRLAEDAEADVMMTAEDWSVLTGGWSR